MAAPVKISANPPDTFQGIQTSQQGSAPKADGPFSIGGNLYLVLSKNHGAGDFQLEIYKSTDSGATWVLKDGANGPHFLGFYAPFVNGSVIEVVYCNLPPDLLRRTTYQEFSTSTDTWGTKSQAANTTDANGDIHIVRFSSGDYLAMYIGSFDAYSIRRTAGVWGTAVAQFAILSSPQGLGLTSDSSDTGYFVWSEVSGGVRRLKMRSLTLGGSLSAESVVSVGTAGAAFVTGPCAIWQSRIIIPQTYDEVGFPDAPAGSPGIWEGTPLAAPVWTFKAAGSTTPGAFLVAFVVVNTSNALVFWTTTPTATKQVKQATYDGTTFGTPTVFYDWNVDPPAGSTIPAASQTLKQPSIAAVGSGYGMAILLGYNVGLDYSTFYLLAVGGGSSYVNHFF